ncbi:extracellular solute-binding protein [Saccharopolyspora erythraea]|uniref:sugar ABC transporter substrate-binding protein n=1 Tax=Saccharopolyspora erythraea TaxID=1836 RepID=UPI001BAD505F|nr:extracellular solute-binding protein [Saccharopolyspora erythraea]QUH03670.1 extracellular solute-binding protein [Saccharopolyspora erythraea]
MRRALAAAMAVSVAVLAAGCGSGFDDPVEQDRGPVTLQVLIGSGTTAETRVLREQTARWAARTGNRVEIVPAAELDQQLGQAFAGGTPPDLFYLSPDSFGRYAGSGNLHAYGDRLRGAADIYPNLREVFTHDGELFCAPKDFSTLALLIDTDAWQAAGLTDADIPRDWRQLADIAQRLTTPARKGLVFDDNSDRIGAFMRQAGGWYLDPTGRKATVDSPENLTALRYVQQLFRSGSTAFSSQVDAGWGGEALGRGTAAMAIDGTWAAGALAADYPGTRWRSVELPSGPAGKGTLSFTNCWGIPERSSRQRAAEGLADFLLDVPQQQQVGREVGVLPSNQRAAQATEADVRMRGFTAGAPYAKGEVTAQGFGAVADDFDAKLLGLARGDDPRAILAEVQRNAERALDG